MTRDIESNSYISTHVRTLNRTTRKIKKDKNNSNRNNQDQDEQSERGGKNTNFDFEMQGGWSPLKIDKRKTKAKTSGDIRPTRPATTICAFLLLHSPPFHSSLVEEDPLLYRPCKILKVRKYIVSERFRGQKDVE